MKAILTSSLGGSIKAGGKRIPIPLMDENGQLDKIKAFWRENSKKVCQLKQTVESGKTDWYDFYRRRKLTTENAVLLVGLLYKMCKVNLVNKAEKEDEINTINEVVVKGSIDSSKKVLAELQ